MSDPAEQELFQGDKLFHTYLSLRLGAEVIVEMNRRYGFSQIFTGVEPGNAPSEAVCTRLGLRATDHSILGMADPDLVPGGRMTK